MSSNFEIRMNAPADIVPDRIFSQEVAYSWFIDLVENSGNVRVNFDPDDIVDWFILEFTGSVIDVEPPPGFLSANRLGDDAVITGVEYFNVDVSPVGEGPFTWVGTGLTIDAAAGNRILDAFETGDRIERRDALADAFADVWLDLFGSDGDDTVGGLDNADVMRGRGGADELSGGGGDDRLIGQRGDDTLAGDDGADTLNGNGGDDVLNAGSGADRGTGGAGDDLLDGDRGADTLAGEQGQDTLEGNAGRDVLVGGGGGDFLDGGVGADTLFGLRGDDELVGGGGRDTFVFRARDGNDVIDDFSPGADVIEIRSGARSLRDLTLDEVGGEAVVSFARTTITFDGVAPSDLSPDDVIFT